MTLSKKDIRALASRLAKVDEGLQRAIAMLNQAEGWTVTGSSDTGKTMSISSLPTSMEAKNALVYIESELADIKQIMQAAGECEYAREARKETRNHV
jgi:hypothetical protein